MPAPELAAAFGACQRIRVWALPRFAVFVSVGMAFMTLLPGATVPIAVQVSPLSPEIETVTLVRVVPETVP